MGFFTTRLLRTFSVLKCTGNHKEQDYMENFSKVFNHKLGWASYETYSMFVEHLTRGVPWNRLKDFIGEWALPYCPTFFLPRNRKEQAHLCWSHLVLICHLSAAMVLLQPSERDAPWHKRVLPDHSEQTQTSLPASHLVSQDNPNAALFLKSPPRVFTHLLWFSTFATCYFLWALCLGLLVVAVIFKNPLSFWL